MDDQLIHPFIALFEQKAQVLDASGAFRHSDEAIVMLAQWLAVRHPHLTESDVIVLTDIGAILYRDGLNRRLSP